MTFTESCELSFKNRLERLVKLHAVKAPWIVIAHEVVLLVKALTLHPEAKFWEMWADSLQPAFRNDAGWCANCGNPHIPDTLCPQCIRDLKAEGPDQ
jgi:hypothetical protein